MNPYPVEVVPDVRTECCDAPVARQFQACPDVWAMWCVRCRLDAGSPGVEDVAELLVDAMVEAMTRG